MGELDLKGISMVSSIGPYPVNHPRFETVWAKINLLKLPVFEVLSFRRMQKGWKKHADIQALWEHIAATRVQV
jgi:hypothetical protein